MGVLSLAIAGIFALLLVLSRVPGADAFFPWIDFFHTALVVHVDQSVLIWFLSMAGVLWSLTDKCRDPSLLRLLSIVLAITGTVGIAVSAFFGEGSALMNNYIPVLQRPLFFISLAVFGSGITLRLILTLIASNRQVLINDSHPLYVASVTVAIATITAIAALLWSWWDIPPEISGQGFFEFLFWGAGHSLQFAYSQLLLITWLLLAVASGVILPTSEKSLGRWLWLGVLPVLAVPVIYFSYPTVSPESRLAFTRLMQYGGVLAAVPIGVILLYGLKRSPGPTPEHRPLRLTLWMSIMLFACGGGIALMISGVNTVIPAHYHGSIVGITLALMGLGYLLLPKLGYRPITGRLASIQPLCYGIGQLLHITGLALSGAMGIQRKTAGAAQGLDSLAAKLSMGVMGIGGLMAVIGGILFVWIMLRAFLQGAKTEHPGVQQPNIQ
ncbi:hypothetical protein BGP75_17995 [Motiliproteus sp. MSK22-1]|nr:hypothetical protein BGP75_17995 [Motiliproteus sp. MSK22-1]